MKKILLLSAALALTACTTLPNGQVDTTGWPDPTQVRNYVADAEAAYPLACTINEKASWCTGSVIQKITACEKIADAGVVTYAEAYASKNVTQAVIDNEAALVPALVSCIAAAKAHA